MQSIEGGSRCQIGASGKNAPRLSGNVHFHTGLRDKRTIRLNASEYGLHSRHNEVSGLLRLVQVLGARSSISVRSWQILPSSVVHILLCGHKPFTQAINWGSQQYFPACGRASRAAISASSMLQDSSSASEVSRIRSFLTDFGIIAQPFCSPHLSRT